jgi:hypothetical protein
MGTWAIFSAAIEPPARGPPRGTASQSGVPASRPLPGAGAARRRSAAAAPRPHRLRPRRGEPQGGVAGGDGADRPGNRARWRVHRARRSGPASVLPLHGAVSDLNDLSPRLPLHMSSGHPAADGTRDKILAKAQVRDDGQPAEWIGGRRLVGGAGAQGARPRCHPGGSGVPSVTGSRARFPACTRDRHSGCCRPRRRPARSEARENGSSLRPAGSALRLRRHSALGRREPML